MKTEPHIIFKVVEVIRTIFESNITKKIEEEKVLTINKKGDVYYYEPRKVGDQTYWILRLFSDFTLPILTNLGTFRDQLKKAIPQTRAKTIYDCWNTTRFDEFMHSLEEADKELLIKNINEIDGVKIENVNDIPVFLKDQFKKIWDKKTSSKEAEIIVPSSSEQPPLSKKHAPFHILIAIILILVLSIIILIIFFVAKNSSDPHVDDKILPNGGTTTFLNSTATTASTEITTISLTNTTSSNIKTSAVSSEAATISTTHPITEKSDSNGNKSDPPVIVVTVNVNNDSHSSTETHTESPQNNTRQEPPVTQEQTTTPPQIATLPISKPEIEISSTEAHRGDSDVCVSVNFENLMYKGSYESIHINFNALYDSTLIFKNCTVSPNNTEINGLTYDNGHISFNMHGNYCENDVTVNLFFDVPDDTPDGDYTIQMLEDASTITLYTNDWFNPRVLLSLDRMGQIHVS